MFQLQVINSCRAALIPGIGIGPIPAIFDGIGIGDYVIQVLVLF